MGRARKTTVDFIEEATAVHGSVYDYSETEYTRSDQPIKYVCPVHGTQMQTAHNHLRGCGCKQCGSEKQRMSLSDFISRASSIHANKYDYSQVSYKNTMSKVTVLCPVHGSFLVTPSKHLAGCGCPSCANKNVTTEVFITKCRVVHGDRYDYSQVMYQPGYSKVKIICRKHGPFLQTTYNHLSNKQGCPVCKYEKARNNIGHYGPALFETTPKAKTIQVTLYLLRCYSQEEQFYKIGLTKCLQARKYSIPYQTSVLVEQQFPLYEAYVLEQSIKNTYQKFIPERHFSGWTECLELSDNDINVITKRLFTNNTWMSSAV